MATDTALELITGLQNQPDAQQVLNSAGNYGQALLSEVVAKYAYFAQKGWVFAARSGAAAAIPIYSTATNSPTLWNPSSSGRLVIPLKALFTHASGAINAFTGFVGCILTNTGDPPAATGLPFATFTNIAPVNVLLGRGSVSTSKFANATVTFTAQPTPLYDLGIGTQVQGTAANGHPYMMQVDFDGGIMLPPGTSLSIAGELASGTALFWTTIVFAEIQAPVSW